MPYASHQAAQPDHCCPHCGASRSDADALARHLAVHHAELGEGHAIGLLEAERWLLHAKGHDATLLEPAPAGACSSCCSDRRRLYRHAGEAICVICIPAASGGTA